MRVFWTIMSCSNNDESWETSCHESFLNYHDLVKRGQELAEIEVEIYSKYFLKSWLKFENLMHALIVYNSCMAKSSWQRQQCAANIVRSCQRYCSALLYLIQTQQYCSILLTTVDNVGSRSLFSICFSFQPWTSDNFYRLCNSRAGQASKTLIIIMDQLRVHDSVWQSMRVDCQHTSKRSNYLVNS